MAETLEINECLKSTEAVNYFTTLWYRCVKNCNWRLFQSTWGVWYLWYRHFKQQQANVLHDCDECFASQQNTKQLRQFFLKYCYNVTNFLFWVFWTCLATSIKNDNTNLKKLWPLSACQKWPPFLTSVLEIL